MKRRAARPAATAAIAVLALIAAAVFAGCGSSGSGSASVPAPDALCRRTWHTLGVAIRGKDASTAPSRLADRWSSIIAGIDYHAVNARASDCDDPLTVQRNAISELSAFEARIQPYDMRLQLAELSGPAQQYLAHPVPTRAGGTKLTAKRVRAAIATLQKFAATAETDLTDGWAEAESVDLDDSTATDRVVSDIAYLAHRSAAYRRCTAAAAVLHAVVRAQLDSLSPSPSAAASSTPSPAASPAASPTG